jgi:hypothetical protein
MEDTPLRKIALRLVIQQEVEFPQFAGIQGLRPVLPDTGEIEVYIIKILRLG